jgi:hypothetical protein
LSSTTGQSRALLPHWESRIIDLVEFPNDEKRRLEEVANAGSVSTKHKHDDPLLNMLLRFELVACRAEGEIGSDDCEWVFTVTPKGHRWLETCRVVVRVAICDREYGVFMRAGGELEEVRHEVMRYGRMFSKAIWSTPFLGKPAVFPRPGSTARNAVDLAVEKVAREGGVMPVIPPSEP